MSEIKIKSAWGVIYTLQQAWAKVNTKTATDAHTGLEPLPTHPQTHTCMEMGRWVGPVQDETATFTALSIKMLYHISCNATH